MRRKSKTCFGANGALTEYGSRSEAREGADYAKAEYGYELFPYACKDCGYFHIGPGGQAPGKTCEHCTSAEGVNKDIYETEGEARRVCQMKGKRGVVLDVYKCPAGNGWHLTKK
ncbi:MAG: hypothetical protein ACR2NQ_04045 [Thermodesulfobacteriota bacterium]